MIQIAEPITLEQLLPLIKQLSKVEHEQLRKSLETDPATWRGNGRASSPVSTMPLPTHQRTK